MTINDAKLMTINDARSANDYLMTREALMTINDSEANFTTSSDP